jgi:hypothetical protein
MPKTLNFAMAAAKAEFHLPAWPTKPWNCLPTVVLLFDRLISESNLETPTGGL